MAQTPLSELWTEWEHPWQKAHSTFGAPEGPFEPTWGQPQPRSLWHSLNAWRLGLSLVFLNCFQFPSGIEVRAEQGKGKCFKESSVSVVSQGKAESSRELNQVLTKVRDTTMCSSRRTCQDRTSYPQGPTREHFGTPIHSVAETSSDPKVTARVLEIYLTSAVIQMPGHCLCSST